MSGIDHAGRIFMGLTIFFRHAGGQSSGTDGLPDNLLSRIDRRMLKRARIIGGALRAAHMISVGMPGIIDQTRLTFAGERLLLTLPKEHSGLDGERLRRRFESLATLLGRAGEVRVES
jgi:exopolyphosphatase/guanosine-5'-triphosphate,3'-diphosphate pyrophosphatase